MTDAMPATAPAPHPMLARLDPLVGAWAVTGDGADPENEIQGRVVFEWMGGGFFLTQYFDLTFGGHPIKGTEIIGYDAARQICVSHCFDNRGNAFLYTWALDDGILTIGGLGSVAGISMTQYEGTDATTTFTGVLRDDRSGLTGRWTWPGGGYTSTMTRILQP